MLEAKKRTRKTGRLLIKDQRRLEELLNKREERDAKREARKAQEAAEIAQREAEEQAVREAEDARRAAEAEEQTQIEEEEGELAELEAKQKRRKIKGKELERLNELTARKSRRDAEYNASEPEIQAAEAVVIEPEVDVAPETTPVPDEPVIDEEKARINAEIAAEEEEIATLISKREATKKKRLGVTDRHRLDSLLQRKTDRDTALAAKEAEEVAAAQAASERKADTPEIQAEPEPKPESKLEQMTEAEILMAQKEEAEIAEIEKKRDASKRKKLGMWDQMRYDELKGRAEERQKRVEKETAATAEAEAETKRIAEEAAQRIENERAAAEAQIATQKLLETEEADENELAKLEKKKVRRGRLLAIDQTRYDELLQRRQDRAEAKSSIKAEAAAVVDAEHTEDPEVNPMPEVKETPEIVAEPEEQDPLVIESEERELEDLRARKAKRKKKFSTADQNRLDELEARAIERAERKVAHEAAETRKAEEAAAVEEARRVEQDMAAEAEAAETAAQVEADAQVSELIDLKFELATINEKERKKAKDMARSLELKTRIEQLENAIASRPPPKHRQSEPEPEPLETGTANKELSAEDKLSTKEFESSPATEIDHEATIASEVAAEEEELRVLKEKRDKKARKITLQEKRRIQELEKRMAEREAAAAAAHEAEEAAAAAQQAEEIAAATAAAQAAAEAEALAAEIAAEEEELTRLRAKKKKGLATKQRIADLEGRAARRAEEAAARAADIATAEVPDEAVADVNELPEAPVPPEVPEVSGVSEDIEIETKSDIHPDDDPNLVEAETEELRHLKGKKPKRLTSIEKIRIAELEDKAVAREERVAARNAAEVEVPVVAPEAEGGDDFQDAEDLINIEAHAPLSLASYPDSGPREEEDSTVVEAEAQELASLKAIKKKRLTSQQLNRIAELEMKAEKRAEATIRACTSEIDGLKMEGSSLKMQESGLEDEALVQKIAAEEEELAELKAKRKKKMPDLIRIETLENRAAERAEEAARRAVLVDDSTNEIHEAGAKSELELKSEADLEPEIDEEELARIEAEEAEFSHLERILKRRGRLPSIERARFEQLAANKARREEKQAKEAALAAEQKAQTDDGEDGTVTNPGPEPAELNSEELEQIQCEEELSELRHKLEKKGRLNSLKMARLRELEALMTTIKQIKAERKAAATTVVESEVNLEADSAVGPEVILESDPEATNAEAIEEPSPEADIDDEELQRVADEEAEMADLRKKLNKKGKLSSRNHARLVELEARAKERQDAQITKAADEGEVEAIESEPEPKPEFEIDEEELQRIANEESELAELRRKLEKKGKLSSSSRARMEKLEALAQERANAKAAREAALAVDPTEAGSGEEIYLADNHATEPERDTSNESGVELRHKSELKPELEPGIEPEIEESEVDKEELQVISQEETELLDLRRRLERKGKLSSNKQARLDELEIRFKKRADAKMDKEAAKQAAKDRAEIKAVIIEEIVDEFGLKDGPSEQAIEEIDEEELERIANEEAELAQLERKLDRKGKLKSLDSVRYDELVQNKIARAEAKAAKEADTVTRSEVEVVTEGANDGDGDDDDDQFEEAQEEPDTPDNVDVHAAPEVDANVDANTDAGAETEPAEEADEESQKLAEEIALEAEEIAALQKKFNRKGRLGSKDQKRFDELTERASTRAAEQEAKKAEEARLQKEYEQAQLEEEAREREEEIAREEEELEALKSKSFKRNGILSKKDRLRLEELTTRHSEREEAKAAREAEDKAQAEQEAARAAEEVAAKVEEERLRQEEEMRRMNEEIASEESEYAILRKKVKKKMASSKEQKRYDVLHERHKQRAEEKAAREAEEARLVEEEANRQAEEEAAKAEEERRRIEAEEREEAEALAQKIAEEELELETLKEKLEIKGRLGFKEQDRLVILENKAEERAAKKAEEEAEIEAERLRIEEERLKEEEEEREHVEAEAAEIVAEEEELMILKTRKKKAKKGKFPAIDQDRLDKLQERADLRAQKAAVKDAEEAVAAAESEEAELVCLEEARIQAEKEEAAIAAEEEELAALLTKKKKSRRGKLAVDDQLRLGELQEREKERAAAKEAKKLEEAEEASRAEETEKDRQEQEEHERAETEAAEIVAEEAEIEKLKAKKKKSKKKFPATDQERLNELMQRVKDRVAAQAEKEEAEMVATDADADANAGADASTAGDDLADLGLENVDLTPEQIEELLAGDPPPKPHLEPPAKKSGGLFASIWGRATGAAPAAPQSPLSPPLAAPEPGDEDDDEEEDNNKDNEEEDGLDGDSKQVNAEISDAYSSALEDAPAASRGRGKGKTGSAASSKSRRTIGGTIADRLKAFQLEEVSAPPPKGKCGKKNPTDPADSFPGTFPNETENSNPNPDDIDSEANSVDAFEKQSPTGSDLEPEAILAANPVEEVTPVPDTEDPVTVTADPGIEVIEAPPPPLPPALSKPSKKHRDKEKDKKRSKREKGKDRAIFAPPPPPPPLPELEPEPVVEADPNEFVEIVNLNTEQKKRRKSRKITPAPPVEEDGVLLTPPSPSPAPPVPPAAPDPPSAFVAADTPRAIRKERAKISRETNGAMFGSWSSNPRAKERSIRHRSDEHGERKKSSLFPKRSAERDEEFVSSKGTHSGSDKVDTAEKTEATLPAPASAPVRPSRMASLFTSTPPVSRGMSTRDKKSSRRQSADITNGLISPPPEAPIASKAARFLGADEPINSHRRKRRTRTTATDDVFMSGALDPTAEPPPPVSPEKRRRSRAIPPEDATMADAPPPAPQPPIPGLKRSSTSASAKKGISGLFSRLGSSKAEPAPSPPRRRNTYATTDDEVLKKARRSRHREAYGGDTTDWGMTDPDHEARREARRRAKRNSEDRDAKEEAKRRRRMTEIDTEEVRRLEEKEARRAERRAMRQAEKLAAEEEERRRAEEEQQERRRRRRAEKEALAAAAGEDADAEARRARRHERRKPHPVDAEQDEERRLRREARRAARAAAEDEAYKASRHQDSYRRNKVSHQPAEDSDRKKPAWPHSGTSSWVKDHSDAPPPPDDSGYPLQTEDEDVRREARRAKRKSAHYAEVNHEDPDEHRRRRRERRETREREGRRTGGSEGSDEKKNGRRNSTFIETLTPPPPPPRQSSSWWKKAFPKR